MSTKQHKGGGKGSNQFGPKGTSVKGKSRQSSRQKSALVAATTASPLNVQTDPARTFIQVEERGPIPDEATPAQRSAREKLEHGKKFVQKRWIADAKRKLSEANRDATKGIARDRRGFNVAPESLTTAGGNLFESEVVEGKPRFACIEISLNGHESKLDFPVNGVSDDAKRTGIRDFARSAAEQAIAIERDDGDYDFGFVHEARQSAVAAKRMFDAAGIDPNEFLAELDRS